MAELQDIKNDDIRNGDVEHFYRLDHVYCWSVSNFSSCLDFSDARVYSPKFKFENSRFQLSLQVFSKDRKLDKIQLRLHKAETCETCCCIKYKIGLFADDSCASEESESKFGGDRHFGHRIVFKYEDHKDILDKILTSNNIVIYCKISSITTVECKAPVEASTTADKSVKRMKKSEASETVDSLSRSLKSKRIYKRKDELDTTKALNSILFFFLLCLIALAAIPNFYFLHNQSYANEVNDLVISTALEVVNIAEALNLDELKDKSLAFLSAYHSSNVSDSAFSKV